jgi:hypothetical protein
MNRLCRWTFSGLTAGSLVLFIAAIGFWIRSYWVSDTFAILDFSSWQFDSLAGILDFCHSTVFRGTFANPQNLNGTIQAGPATRESPALFFQHGVWGPIRPPSSWSDKLFQILPSAQTYVYLDRSGQQIPMVSRGKIIEVKAWLVVILAAVLPAARGAVFVKGMHRRRLARRGICLHCGYDLRATPQRCPECGTMASEAEGRQ